MALIWKRSTKLLYCLKWTASNPETLKQKTKELKQASGQTPMQMSSVTHLGTDDVLRQMMQHIEAVKAIEEPEVEDSRWSQSGLDDSRDAL